MGLLLLRYRKDGGGEGGKSSRTRPPPHDLVFTSFHLSCPSQSVPHNLFYLFFLFFFHSSPAVRTHIYTSSVSSSLIHTSFFSLLSCRLRQAALIRQRGRSSGSLIGRLQGRLPRFLHGEAAPSAIKPEEGEEWEMEGRWGAASAQAVLLERGRRVCKTSDNIWKGVGSIINTSSSILINL